MCRYDNHLHNIDEVESMYRMGIRMLFYPPEILHGPENTTVFLDQSAVFSCETRGGVTSWFINGTLRRNLPHEVRNDIKFSKTKKNLTISARAKYNGTIVQCVILGDGSSAESENATLQIQGTSGLHVMLSIHNIMLFLPHATIHRSIWPFSVV